MLIRGTRTAPASASGHPWVQSCALLAALALLASCDDLATRPGDTPPGTLTTPDGSEVAEGSDESDEAPEDDGDDDEPPVFKLGGPSTGIPGPPPESMRATFGAHPVGTTAGPESVTFVNNNEAPVSLTIAVTDETFSVADDGCGGVLTVGESCTVAFTFTPASSGVVADFSESELMYFCDASIDGRPCTDVTTAAPEWRVIQTVRLFFLQGEGYDPDAASEAPNPPTQLDQAPDTGEVAPAVSPG